MTENEHPDHRQLMSLLQQAKPLMEPMFPDQRRDWVADSPLAQEILAVLVKHPEYYDEITAHVGAIFAKPKS